MPAALEFIVGSAVMHELKLPTKKKHANKQTKGAKIKKSLLASTPPPRKPLRRGRIWACRACSVEKAEAGGASLSAHRASKRSFFAVV